ncbi:hypothetical protein GLOTRDRAFT_48439 [Gloeophyllum trabeum ATCC 11539]|uniref:Yeast cell wall synthesis Kre9/Knh1-like N-terminal domain-containing protein n=1 Tax=Gloeophyllum trabeum (strain ATCC 11539 / FP-39264 / Madison 617) TaxID=670483 RepID=S7PWB7_GLOTA|nr:uncharacterized protein GLOTRDRAFT_48439 [Gloeophyllum trabeum ATCC 11539]EPQ51813.1 hypothetical protein GLOTRDRAFT_48439 [Gloeophyllum trabeum ATCC 11539]
MFASSFAALALAALAPSALATVYTTSPVGGTTWTAGQQATISWQDDGSQPSLASFGASKVSIYVGNAIQQTMLQPITGNVDVSTTSSIVFTPDGSIGPDGSDYFVRFESLNLKDSTNPQYPALAFSAKFTMKGMTGTFNSTVQAQIDGASTAPLAQPTAASAATTGASAAHTTAATSSKASSASGSATASAKAAAASNSGSQQIAATGLTTVVGVVAAVFGLAIW